MLNSSASSLALRLILVAGVPLLILSSASSAREEIDKHIIYFKGKVVDQHNHAVPRAKITVVDKEQGAVLSASSNSQGEFQIEHEPAGTKYIEVTPPAKSGLAQAILTSVSSDQTKHLIFRLHKGFTLTGRVVSNGKGLRGISVRAIPSDKKHADAVHGGGHTVTSFNGSFRMVLTPGEKELEISNEKYPELARMQRHSISVTRDSALADIELAEARNQQ